MKTFIVGSIVVLCFTGFTYGFTEALAAPQAFLLEKGVGKPCPETYRSYFQDCKTLDTKEECELCTATVVAFCRADTKNDKEICEYCKERVKPKFCSTKPTEMELKAAASKPDNAAAVPKPDAAAAPKPNAAADGSASKPNIAGDAGAQKTNMAGAPKPNAAAADPMPVDSKPVAP